MASGTPQASGAPSTYSSSAEATSSSGLPPPPPPKILLAKPASGTVAPRLGRDDDPSVFTRFRNAPHPGSLCLISDSWEVHIDRILPFLTDNSDFTVIGIIGTTGAGKSTIMNELYGFDGSSPGMLPPFATQTDETRATAKHLTTGVELRVSSERLVLLDTQPIFSPSVLVDMTRPDGSSAIPVLSGEYLSADLAHELMGIQLGVFLASVCNIVLVVSEGIHDFCVWQLMHTVDLLKHNIPDPSTLAFSQNHGSVSAPEKEIKSNNNNIHSPSDDEYLASLVFIHTNLKLEELSLCNITLLKKARSNHFRSSSFTRNNKSGELEKDQIGSVSASNLFVLPLKAEDESQKPQFESYSCMLGKLCDQILSMEARAFRNSITERDWLRNSAKIWGMVKKLPIIAEYSKTLSDSGLFRR